MPQEVTHETPNSNEVSSELKNESTKENVQSIYGPHGRELPHSEEVHETSRSLERKREDEEYIPVILKRTDEAIKHPDDILEKAIHEGLQQHERPFSSLFLSAMAAGFILAMAGLSVAIVTHHLTDDIPGLLHRLIPALVYPLGFIICLMSSNQLFTEQTATALYPVLDRKCCVKSLFGLWSMVILGNLLGTFIMAAAFHNLGLLGTYEDGVLKVYHHFISPEFGPLFLSSMLAGWLMAQGGWLVLSTPPASSQVLCIYIVTFLIGLAGFHHSIAGSAEVFFGLFQTDGHHIGEAMSALGISLLGNLVGGSCLVGLLNYGHIRKMQ